MQQINRAIYQMACQQSTMIELRQFSKYILIKLIENMEADNKDREIREKLKKKDVDFQDELRTVMEDEEKQLKQYFKEFKQPVKKDPTQIKKSEVSTTDRNSMAKELFRPFTVFSKFYYNFWMMECATVEEKITHQLCKKVDLQQAQKTMNNIVIGVGMSLLVTSFVSFRLGSKLPRSIHALGFGTALATGFLYGAITSTKFTLQQFEKLGPGYQMGRIVSADIEKYRMDTTTKRN